MNTKLLRKGEVVDFLDVSPRSIDRIVARGEIETVRVGGALRFTPAGLQRYVEKQTARRGGGDR